MTNFYNDQRHCFRDIAAMVNSSKESKVTISVPSMVLQLTTKHAVSERAIKKRLQLIAKVEPNFFVEDEQCYWEYEKTTAAKGR